MQLKPIEVKVGVRRIAVTLERRGKKGFIRCVFWHEGRRYAKSTKCNQERDARTEARRSVERVIAGRRRARGLVTLKEAIDAYLAARWPKMDTLDATYRDHEYRLRIFNSHAGAGTNICGLTESEATRLVQDFVDQKIEDKNSPTSVDNWVRVVHRFFTWLLKREYTAWSYNPAGKGKLDLPAKKDSRHIPIRAEEVAALMLAAKDDPLYPAVLLGFAAGLRPIGIGRVRVQDFDAERGVLVVFEKNKHRLVGLPPSIAEKLQSWIKAKKLLPEDRIWPRRTDMMFRQIRRLRRRAGIGDHVTFQGLRRYHSTLCYACGMLPHEEAMRLGHSVTIAEKRYVQWQTLNESVSLGKIDEEVRKIAARPPQKPPQERTA